MTPPSALDMDVAQADYDALADLFLSDDTLAPAKQGQVSPAPTASPLSHGRTVAPSHSPSPVSLDRCIDGSLSLEGVIAGHLPVLASAWVTQYARNQADTHHEPVVLMRLIAGQAMLDLVLPSGLKIPPDIHAKPTDPFAEVLSRTAARFRRWVIRVDEPSESDLFGQNLSSIAILTGADDPAVLASYQTIKGLAQDLPESAPALKLVVMGASDAKADAAEQKLRRAVTTFLSRQLEPAVRIPKIGSSLAVQLYRAPASSSIADVLTTIRATQPAPVTTLPSVDEPLATRPTPPTAIPTPELVARARVQSQANGQTNGHHANGHQPSPAPASRVGPIAHSDPYLSHLHLTALPITCPYAQGIRFGLDARGSLHLLAADLPSPEAASRLLTAAAWTNDHAALLAAAAPAMTDASNPTLHILTTDARQSRALLDTGLKLHLITKVELAGQVAYSVSPLN